MKVLMISGDPNLLKNGSAVRERHSMLVDVVGCLDVFVWPSAHGIAEIWRAARQNRYDVITAQDPFWRGMLGWLVARGTGARLNLQLHADLDGQSLSKRLLARFSLRRADSIRVVSERTKAQVMRLNVRTRITVLPVFIEVHRMQDETRTSHPRFARTILWIGRFEREKDPLAALEILREVLKTYPTAGLIMLGSGSLESQVKDTAQDLPIEFPGWQNPGPYFALSDVVVSTSSHESFGASIVEALAAGVPVVAPDVGIAREAGAFVVPRCELAAKVSDVLSNPVRGKLLLNLPSAEEWGKQWRESLV
ncbi:hypothetical protein A2678_01590 [Candidatus Kaiserbacteria bacterium RIFCSPHIGHO2_01_FULL_53_31]|uniref:Glycosyltransferase subfamily 4-like N-terminal domain-containing protein n=1 Tax=Candidatus Kaiserbacteria bacterium RIFCSPHIGHO2_01_FULL_53_31 TaxID=1798481 RepID=A0A1F6CGK2_9BACT|nr:MAG: hypothetical protein A2678_01590 [Candidatus Kaiserbacteria bacterium RIFCSPHIGHO2_01_FULL_53_31]